MLSVLLQRKEMQLKHPANFQDRDGNFYLVRCVSCDTENYGPMVATGICYKCGWDVRKVTEGEGGAD